MVSNIEVKAILKNRKGFTLIEVLIAIAILSVLMTAIYSIVDNSVNTNDRVSKEDREILELEIGLMRLTRDLELIHSPLYFDTEKVEDNKKLAALINASKNTSRSGSTGQSQSQGQNQGSSQSQSQQQNQTTAQVVTSHVYQNRNFDNLSTSNAPIPIVINEEKGSLVFLSSSNRRLLKDSKQSNLMWIRYRVATTSTEGVDEEEQNKEAPYSLTRTVITKDLYDTELDWEKAKEYAVINNLKDFSFEFYSPEKEKFVSSLKELNKLRKTPRLFRVNMEYLSKTGEALSISRTIRVLWPDYNGTEDLKEKYDKKN